MALNGCPNDVALFGAVVGAVIQVNVGATKSPFETGNGSVKDTSTVPVPVFAYDTLNGVRYWSSTTGGVSVAPSKLGTVTVV
jgi:hypothetical protein